MNLFERIKNIRKNNLQENIKFPGGTGDIGFTAPKRGEKVQKRLDRADKLGTPDPFDADYDKKVKKVDKRTKIGKAFQTPKKSDLKKLDKQPGGYRAPKSDFGPGITKGQANVKEIERSSFKKTKPSDVKLPKSFTDFQRNLQNYKDRNVPGGPRKTGRTSFKGQGSGSRFDPDIGMAPPDTPPKKKTLSATDYTKKINQANKNRKEFIGNKKTFSAFKKQADAATNKLVSKREVVRSTTDTKDVKKLRDINKQIKASQRISKGYDLASKGIGKPNTPVVASDLKAVTDNTPKITSNITEPPEGKALTGRKINKKPIQKYRIEKSKKFGIKPKNILTTRQKKDLLAKRTKQVRTITKKMGGQGTVDLLRKVTKTGIGKKIYSKPAGKLALKSTAGIVKAASKNPYTAAATVVGAGLLTQPNVRKGIKAALTGGGIGALTGAFAKDNRKNKPAEYGKKTYIKKGSISISPPPAPKDKPRTPQSIATEVDYLKKRQKVAPYGAKYTG